jgi:hypothetical protein
LTTFDADSVLEEGERTREGHIVGQFQHWFPCLYTASCSPFQPWERFFGLVQALPGATTSRISIQGYSLAFLEVFSPTLS